MLPDWAKAGPRGTEAKLPAKEVTLGQGRLKAFMSKAAEDADRARDEAGVSKSTESARLIPNQFYVLSLESALKGGLGIDLRTFLLARPPAALLQNQSRYYVPAASQPGAQVQQAPPGTPGRIRSCIMDEDSGARWYEVPDFILEAGGQPSRPALHICCDKGTVGWPGLQWLIETRSLRATVLPDPLHQDWNGLRAAALQCGGVADHAGEGHHRQHAIWPLPGVSLLRHLEGSWAGVFQYSHTPERALPVVFR